MGHHLGLDESYKTKKKKKFLALLLRKLRFLA